VDDDPALLRALDRLAEVPSLLVACRFDGVLADATDDPADARAEQESSEALNVLLALSGTRVAVVSDRPGDEVHELMFLSGAKGGLRVVDADGLAALRSELNPSAVMAIGVDPGETGPDDLVIEVGVDADGHQVEDVEGVAEILGELVSLRRWA